MAKVFCIIKKNKKMTRLSFQIRETLVQSVVLLLLFSAIAMAKTYRWVDENGKVFYSHNIPPSAAQNGHIEINEKSGRVLNDIASRSEREKDKQKALLLEAKEKEKQLRMREELSLQVFSSRAEIEKHFERRLEMVSVNLRLLAYHKRKLLKKITKIQKNATTVKTRKVKNDFSKRLRKLQSTLLEHTRAIENNQQEQVLTNNNRKRALAKYDEREVGGDINGFSSHAVIKNNKK